MPYEVVAGRIATWALEAHVVDHRNLRCHQCCTLSPWLPTSFVDPETLERDLRLAARVLAPSVFKLTGGEPTLHPRLDECVEAAQASGISPVLSLTTTGLLAATLPDKVFDLLDRITLSVYASAPVPVRTLERIEERCTSHGVRLTVKPIGVFQDMTPPSRGDSDHATRVFASCWLKVRCHTIPHGRFYPCTRPPHLAQASVMGPSAGDLSGDGVELDGDGPDVRRRVLRLLESEDPLVSCRWCLGGTGGWGAHRQV